MPNPALVIVPMATPRACCSTSSGMGESEPCRCSRIWGRGVDALLKIRGLDQRGGESQ